MAAQHSRPGLARTAAVFACTGIGVMMAAPVRGGAGDDDPFVRPAEVQPVAPTTPGSLDQFELTGVSALGGRTVVCLLDRAAQRTRWFALGAAEDGLVAAEYDAEREAVRIEAAGTSRWVALRKSAITAMTLPRLEGGAIDWAHLRMSDKEKAREAEAMMTDMLEVGQMARMGRLGQSPP